MKTKFHLRYILFALLVMFICMTNVKASTTYLTCEYRNDSEAEKFNTRAKATRFIFQNGKCILSKGQDTRNDKWNTSVTFYDDNKKPFERVSSTDCPKQGTYEYIYKRYYTKTMSFPLKSQKKYEVEDMTCWYKMDDTNILKLTIPSSFYGINPVETSTGRTIYEYLPVKESEVDAINFQPISKSWFYLKNVNDTNSCPTYILDNGKYVYLTYSDKMINIKAVDKTGNNSLKGKNSEYKSHKLVCNEDALYAVTNGITSIKNNFINTLNAYDNRSSDYWNDLRKICKDDNKCICKNETNNNDDFIQCEINRQFDKGISDVYKYVDSEKKLVKQVGCEIRDTNFNSAIKEMEEKYKEKLKILKDVGGLSEDAYNEAYDKATEGFEELRVSIKELLDKFFTPDNSKLSGVGNNNEVDCDAIFGNSCDKDNLSLMCFITTIFNIFRYLIPAILIILGSIDFGKVVISSEKEAMSKAVSTFVTRVIISIVIFFLPLLIHLLLTIFNKGYTIEDKINCVIESLR